MKDESFSGGISLSTVGAKASNLDRKSKFWWLQLCEMNLNFICSTKFINTVNVFNLRVVS